MELIRERTRRLLLLAKILALFEAHRSTLLLAYRNQRPFGTTTVRLRKARSTLHCKFLSRHLEQGDGKVTFASHRSLLKSDCLFSAKERTGAYFDLLALGASFDRPSSHGFMGFQASTESA